MKMMKTLLFLGMSALSCSTGTNNRIMIQEYVNRNTVNFMKYHERAYGLSYEGVTGLPVFRYGPLPKRHIGEIDFSNNTITFDTDKIIKLSRKGVTRKVDRNEVNRMIENALHHELVHFNNNLIRHSIDKTWNGTIPEKIVEEGTAKYIADTLTKIENTCTDFTDKKPEDYNDAFIYQVGYCTLGTVITRYQEKGISYMFANLPTNDEIKNPYTYRTRILKELEAETQSKYRALFEVRPEWIMPW